MTASDMDPARGGRLLFFLLLLGAPAIAAGPRLPEREPGADSGTRFALRIAEHPDQQRQREAAAEVVAGNVPGFLRIWCTVDMSGPDAEGRSRVLKVDVFCDYLAVGQDEDYLRFPFDLPFALTLARALDAGLPTRKTVDAVYDQADVHLEPQPLAAGPKMYSMDYSLRHRAAIGPLIRETDQGLLVAGHKKDLVVSAALIERPDRLAIYGWHRSTDDPIQGLSLFHGAHYADYSHGLRLVSRRMWLDGTPVDYFEVLEDPVLAPLLSDEGALPGVTDLHQPLPQRGWPPNGVLAPEP